MRKSCVSEKKASSLRAGEPLPGGKAASVFSRENSLLSSAADYASDGGHASPEKDAFSSCCSSSSGEANADVPSAKEASVQVDLLGDDFMAGDAGFESLLFDAAGAFAWELRRDAGLLRFGRQCSDMLGYENGEMDSVRALLEIVHPEDRVELLRRWHSHSAGSCPSFQAEFRARTISGTWLWLAVSGRIVRRGPGGRALRALGICWDAGDRLAAEAELKSQFKTVSIVNEELLEYIRAISHDLRNPLRAIHGYASFLQEDLVSSIGEEQERYFEALLKAAVDADSLVDGLLRVSQVSACKMEWQMVDMGALLSSSLPALEAQCGASFEMSGSWPSIMGEPTLLRQIFQNLVANAIKFNKSAQRKVWLSWSESRTHWIFSVADNGIGIDRKDAKRVFRVFERLHPKEFEGTGIGLAIVERAVRRLAGSISLDLAYRGGAKFDVFLPKKVYDQKGGLLQRKSEKASAQGGAFAVQSPTIEVRS